LVGLPLRYPDGSAARVVVIESRGLLHARLKASLAGADRGLEFTSGHQPNRQSRERLQRNVCKITSKASVWLSVIEATGLNFGALLMPARKRLMTIWRQGASPPWTNLSCSVDGLGCAIYHYAVDGSAEEALL
jgi:hypothetical protein